MVKGEEEGSLSTYGCVIARGRTHSKVVLSRPLQQPYTPLGSRVFTYEFRSFTKKYNDSLVG